MKVSIITITKNSASTIEDTIRSVINQTYQDIEYVIIDGGSTDGTLEIIDSYRDKIAVCISEKDKGISDAFNKGILNSSGGIIGIINSDDVYEPYAVQEAVNAFKMYLDNKEGFIFGDQLFVNREGQMIELQKGDPNFKEVIYRKMPSIPSPTVFVHKAIYEKVGLFSLNYKIAMDYDLFLRIAKAGYQGVYVPKVLTRMRLGGVSDVQKIAAFREERIIAISYGANPLATYSLFYFKLIKTYLRKTMAKAGLLFLVKWIRKHINSHYSPIN